QFFIPTKRFNNPIPCSSKSSANGFPDTFCFSNNKLWLDEFNTTLNTNDLSFFLINLFYIRNKCLRLRNTFRDKRNLYPFTIFYFLKSSSKVFETFQLHTINNCKDVT